MVVILLVLYVIVGIKDGENNMDLFKQASKLAAGSTPASTRKRVRKGGVITRRNGVVISDTVKRSAPSIPVVKKVKRMDKELMSAECIDDWLNPVSRRKALGKYVYTQREELIPVLRDGYGVDISELELLSLNSLLSVLDEERARQIKSLELQKKEEKGREERLGVFYNSFNIVSDVTSVYNTEHYKKSETVVDEDIDYGVAVLTPEERKERRAKQQAEWEERKVVLVAKRMELWFEQLAIKHPCWSLEQIMIVIDGKQGSYVTLDEKENLRLAAIEKERIAKRGVPKRMPEYSKGSKNGFLEGLI